MSALSAKNLGIGCNFWRILGIYKPLIFCILRTIQT